jgi:hypothetical protein
MNAKSDVANASSIDLDDQMIAENGLHAVSIGDLLINGSCVALIAAQTRRIPAIFIRSHAAPRQFVAESSICVFFTRILTAALQGWCARYVYYAKGRGQCPSACVLQGVSDDI